MRSLALIAMTFLSCGSAFACNPAGAIFSQYPTAFGPQMFYQPTALSYAMPMPYVVQAPTYVAPSPYATIGFPAQTPITIVNNNNNARGMGGTVGASFVPAGVLSPSLQVNTFAGRRAARQSGVGVSIDAGPGLPAAQVNTFVGRRAVRFGP